MADKQSKEVVISTSSSVKLSRWRVSAGSEVREGSVLCLYEVSGKAERTGSFVTQPKLKSAFTGKVRELLVAEGDIVPAGAPVLLIDKATECEHKIVMKDLCCDCGADLRKLNEEQDEPSSPTLASVPLIHNIPELKVSPEEAEALGKKDEARLLKTRKLSLIVDLDQTLIHTTMELIPEDMEDVHHFQLPGYPVWYHTKIRPGAVNFLKSISELYELHIFTMGSRMYAHTIARMLDPDGKLFAYRIRSRDECFNAFSKSHDMRSLFPCGDNMVCIIDDREDVWNFAPNLIHVKPYQFFKGVGDINAPPGSTPPPEEEFTSPAEEVGEKNNQEKDIEAEEVNSLETEDVAHQEKNDDTVFKDNKKSEETEIDVVLNEKMSLGKSEENVEVTEDKIEPVGEGVDEINAKKSSVDDVKSNVDSSKVLENGQSENADDETKPEESNETKEINQNDKEEDEEGEKNNNGDTKGDKEQTTSICNDEITGETPEKSCEGVQTKFKKSQKYSYEFGDGDDDYLLHLEDVLKRVHEVFYKTLDEIKSISAEELKGNPNSTSGVKYCTPGTTTPDAKAIVTELRRDVLLGANIVFTGVIPTSAEQEESYPWRVACALGAKVSNTIVTPKDTTNPSDVTTHVIAGRLGTEKSYRAVKTRGVRLVNPGWLFCCSERWERVDERLFPVEGLEKYKQQIRDQGTPCGTPRDTVMENADLGTGDTGEDAENKSRSESVSSADILMSTLNPLLSFSPSEVEAMDKEVEDLMNASDEESDLIGSVSDSSSPSDSEDSKSTSKRKRGEEEESQEDANNESPSKKRKVSDDVDDDDEVKDIDNDNDHEGEGGSEDSSKSDSDDDYTHRSSPSDDDDDMAAMLDAELAQS